MEDLILHGDVYSCLNVLEGSIAVVVTSPPYWKQRDYGFEGQIGQERTPEEYIGRLVTVFRKLREKMRDDGVFFLNVGDKYLRKYGKSHLLQIPYRLTYHLIEDGWHLRDIIIWYKTNHMPSPVEDRFANTYEPIIVLTKGERSIYRDLGSVVKVPLQRTPWKHTAVFPERLVVEMLSRVRLEDGDLILDPFAGTGTVASVVKKLRGSMLPEVRSIMIEKCDDFVEIMKERARIERVEEVEDEDYDWEPVRDERLPQVEPKEVLSDEHGEVYIAPDSGEFLSILRGITTERFKSFHREDALYFFGVRDWSILDLYYAHSIFHEGYLLRNMLVVSSGRWYPVFMIARDTKRVEHKFHLDRVKVKPKASRGRDWWREDFLGMRVRDGGRDGRVVGVIERYDNGFPKVVAVRWGSEVSLEFALNPDEDELIMESLIFKCPKCGSVLEEPYDPIGENKCRRCGSDLWRNFETLPIVEEPPEIARVYERMSSIDVEGAEVGERGGRKPKSKFSELDRVNWGASPGARKTMLGEYFTKMRLYRVDQPIVACYLTILRKRRGLSVKDVVERLPESYEHTAGHWFRRDMGGSIPTPEDLRLLKEILGADGLLSLLERRALKLETVKNSVKGKNPGDFIEGLDGEELILYFKKLYIPSHEYRNILDLNKQNTQRSLI